MAEKNIFEKIIDRELPADIVFENERILAIQDIAPKAPVHLLIMPKKVIHDIQSISEEDLPLIGECVIVAQKLAEQFNVQGGYRLLTNCGPSAGQSVFHLHFHLLGGRPLGMMG
ncbi:MAG: Purine nucleoside phosphoramidase [Chlamydiae bacterium]|nr:Purine nucleoside phosphoramidase [Chlamydiota bacterium]